MIKCPNKISTRIICIGNLLYPPDSAGPKVFKLLSQQHLPEHIELVDGGLGGLNLLPCLEGVKRVIFVDAIEGFLCHPGVKVMTLPSRDITTDSYNHDAGLSYLLAVAPRVIDSAMPECFLVGIEGDPDEFFCRQAAMRCLELTPGISKFQIDSLENRVQCQML